MKINIAYVLFGCGVDCCVVWIVAWFALVAEFGLREANPLLFAIVPGFILARFFVLKQRNILPFTNELVPNNQMLELVIHSYLSLTYVVIITVYHSVSSQYWQCTAYYFILKSRKKITLRYSFSLILLGIAKLTLIDTADVVL